MKQKTRFERYLLMNPLIKGFIEWGIIVAIGILSIRVNIGLIPLFPIINIFGFIIIAFGFILHIICEKTHKQAHVVSEKIINIVTNGIYSIIRHPIYLTLIIINIGIALVFNSWLALIVSVFISILPVLTIFREEEYLTTKFPHEYGEYMKSVKWRLIPGIF